MNATQVGVIAVVLCSLVLIPTAHANEANAAAARRLYMRAQALMLKGDIDTACKMFKASLDALPKNGTRLHLARCHEKQGRIATAYREYGEVAIVAHKRNNRPRKAEALRRRNKLRPQLSKLVVRPSNPLADVTVTVDGKPLAFSDYGVPHNVDPGDHVIEATGTGFTRWREVVVVGANGDRKKVTVPIPEATSGEAEDNRDYTVPITVFTLSGVCGVSSVAILGAYVQDTNQSMGSTGQAQLKSGFAAGLGAASLILSVVGVMYTIVPQGDDNDEPKLAEAPTLSLEVSPSGVFIGGQVAF